jgi:hypothetical protein
LFRPSGGQVESQEIFTSLAFPPVSVEKSGRIIFDIAASPLPGVFSPEAAYQDIWNEWIAETEIPGFAGTCYRWGGPDVKWNAGCGILTYWYFIDEPGLYRITIRNISCGLRPDAAGRGNGAFMRIDGGQWHKVKSTEHGAWTWSFMYEHYHDPTDENPSRVPCWRHFDHGIHKMALSGRTHGLIFDRVAIAREGVEAHDPSLPVSETIPLPEREPVW